MKKYLGIFYKSKALWLHYIPLVVIIIAVVYWTASIFGMPELPKWYISIFLFILLYITISISDQIIHAIMGMFGVKD